MYQPYSNVNVQSSVISGTLGDLQEEFKKSRPDRLRVFPKQERAAFCENCSRFARQGPLFNVFNLGTAVRRGRKNDHLDSCPRCRHALFWSVRYLPLTEDEIKCHVHRSTREAERERSRKYKAYQRAKKDAVVQS